jgi:integrase
MLTHELYYSSKRRKPMIYKRGGRVWYRFMWKGELVRESTKQGNDKVARQIEAAHRTSLAKGEVGIRERKSLPSLKEFCDQRFAPWAKSAFAQTTPKSWEWYRLGIRALLSYKPLACARLNEIRGEAATAFAVWRRRDGLEVSTVNSGLRVLRSILRRAVEWSVLENAPAIKLLPGERHRERVITREEEAKYLAVAGEPLASVAIVLVDSGLRPEECYRLRWENITWLNGRNGTLFVANGKTPAARRVIPMTVRVRGILESLWAKARKVEEGWVWPAPTSSGHVEVSSFRKQHAAALKISKVRHFVLYSLRHTFLTRLGESGCDVWTLARVAGHSSISISSRYVHPSEDAVLDAITRLGGHKIGHNQELVDQEEKVRLLTQ